MLPNPYVIIAMLVGFALAVAGSFYEGTHYEHLKQEAAVSAKKDEVIDVMAKSEVINSAASTAQALAVQKIDGLTQTLIMEVPKYVTVKYTEKCGNLPLGFVRLHDAAASGLPPVPDPAGQSNDAASSVDLARAGSVVATNYGNARANAEQLANLQALISRQQKLSNGDK
jgi:hypothetical protein